MSKEKLRMPPAKPSEPAKGMKEIEAYRWELSMHRIEKAYKKRAKHIKGEGHNRNKIWRILEEERRLFSDEESF